MYLSQSQKEEKKLRSYIEKTIGIDNIQKYFIEDDDDNDANTKTPSFKISMTNLLESPQASYQIKCNM